MSSLRHNVAVSPLADCLSELVIDGGARTVAARLCCPPEFAGFVGHFPVAPVLPAVMQLLAVRLLAESVVKCGLLPISVERLKFKGMVAPGDVVRIRVGLKDRAQGLAAEFSLDREGAAIASGTMVFRLPGEEA